MMRGAARLNEFPFFWFCILVKISCVSIIWREIVVFIILMNGSSQWCCWHLVASLMHLYWYMYFYYTPRTIKELLDGKRMKVASRGFDWVRTWWIMGAPIVFNIIILLTINIRFFRFLFMRVLRFNVDFMIYSICS